MVTILVCCVCPIQADEAVKVAHLVYPESRSGDLAKGAQLKVESRKELVESFVERLKSYPLMKFRGVWLDAGFPIIFADEKMNPIKAYKVYDFPNSKGVFIEFDVKRDGDGFKLGDMKLTAEFRAKQWPELSIWLAQNRLTALSAAMEK